MRQPRCGRVVICVTAILVTLTFSAADTRAGDTVMVLARDGQQYDVLHDAGSGFMHVATHFGFAAAPIGVHDWSDDGTFVGIMYDGAFQQHLTVIDPRGRLKFNPVLPAGANVLAVFHTALPHHIVALLGPPQNAVAIIEKATGAMLTLYNLPTHFAFSATMFSYDNRRHRLYYCASIPNNPSVSALFESDVLTGKTRAILAIPRGLYARNGGIEPITGALGFGVYGGPGVESFGIVLNGQLILNTPVVNLKSVAAGPRDVTLRNYAFVPSASPPTVITLALQNYLIPTTHPLLSKYRTIRAVGLKP